jgi:hypothetical protein
VPEPRLEPGTSRIGTTRPGFLITVCKYLQLISVCSCKSWACFGAQLAVYVGLSVRRLIQLQNHYYRQYLIIFRKMLCCYFQHNVINIPTGPSCKLKTLELHGVDNFINRYIVEKYVIVIEVLLRKWNWANFSYTRDVTDETLYVCEIWDCDFNACSWYSVFTEAW